MAATFSGIASGIDSASLIQSMVSVARQPIARLQTKQTSNSTMSKKFTDIKAKLTALQTASRTLDTRSEVMVNKVSSADEKIVKASSAGGGSLGTFDVKVTSVAKAERTYSTGFSASDESGLFGSGDLTIQVGTGSAVTLEVTNQDTLESLATKINNANLGVTAGLVYNGSQYRLQVSGNETGTDHAIALTGAGADGLGLSDIDNQFQAASNAVVMIDDISVTSQTNTVSTAIPGVTINVVGLGTSNVSISRDPEGLKTKLEGFVKAYNDVMTAMNAEFASSGTQKAAGSLSGDSTLRGVQSDLRGLMTQDLSSLTTSFGSFGAMGLSLQRDGTITIDSDKLTKAVNKDYEGVTAVFAGVGTNKGLMAQLTAKLDPYVRSDGSITARVTNLASRNRDIDAQVARQQVRIDNYEMQLQRQFASLESLMGGLQSQGAALSSIINS